MYQGSCLCGEVKYELLSEPKKVSHCHCSMCQKQHGAAFATYASVIKSDLVYTQGAEYLAQYNSSGTVQRKFCKKCGSSIEWSGSESYPDWAAVTLGTLDRPFKSAKIIDIYVDSKACWLDWQGAEADIK